MVKINKYETIFIVDVDRDEEAVNALVAREDLLMKSTIKLKVTMFWLNSHPILSSLLS